ncbi:MAG TPA: hypothetical protein VN700_04175 [Vicinamibacterales bacterium]|nr:hypothetical protein [Vicinamibacterales bacterium]
MRRRTDHVGLAISILFAMVLSVAISLGGVAAGLSTPVVAGVAGVVATVLVPVIYRFWSAGKDA